MFGGIGGSEIIIIAVLFLVIFGPNKLPEMARDIGRFVNEARRSIDEFKNELSVEDDTPTRRRDTPKRTNGTRDKNKVADSEDSPAPDSIEDDGDLAEDGSLSENAENGDRPKKSGSPEPELRDL